MSRFFTYFLVGLLFSPLFSQAVGPQCHWVFQMPPLTQNEVAGFFKEHGLLNDPTLSRLQRETSAYQFGSNDLGKAFLLKAIQEMGTAPSAGVDLIYRHYFQGVFTHYERQFQSFLKSPDSQRTLQLPALFGLATSMPEFVKNEKFQWGPESSQAFAERVHQAFAKETGVDLRMANELLVQLVYLVEELSNRSRMSLAEMTLASHDYLQISQAGHVFVPTPGGWDEASIVAQWYLKVTVNMLPPDLAGVSDIHGGIGGLDGLAHDQGHVNMTRHELIAKVVFGPEANLSDPSVASHVTKVEKVLQKIMTETLLQEKQRLTNLEDGNRLINTAFFIVHEPMALSQILKDAQAGTETQDLALKMRATLEQMYDFYPNLGTDYDSFQTTAAFWIAAFRAHSLELKTALSL